MCAIMVVGSSSFNSNQHLVTTLPVGGSKVLIFLFSAVIIKKKSVYVIIKRQTSKLLMGDRTVLYTFVAGKKFISEKYEAVRICTFL